MFTKSENVTLSRPGMVVFSRFLSFSLSPA